MEKEEKKFEVEEIIPVGILEDAKQMRVTIPKEIVDIAGINSNSNEFAWIIEKEKGSNNIEITGKFILKRNGKEKD